MAVFKLRLLPTVMIAGVIAFGIHALELVEDVVQITGPAVAQDAEPENQATGDGGEAQESGQNILVEEPVDATLNDPAFMSRSEVELLRDLAKRRTELQQREQEVATRERVLEATEKRIGNKIAELKTLEQKISGLIGQYEDEQDKQFDNLVSVYEKMKAKDAARIFQRLDLDIQVSVAQRMNDRKFAPLLAEMDSEAAKALSTELAQRATLPSLEADG